MTVLWNKLYSFRLFDGIRLQGQIYEDDDVMYRILARIETAVLVTAPLYDYRTRTGSTMTTAWSEKNLAILDVYRRRSEYFDRMGDDELALLARRNYFNTLIWTHPQVHQSMIAARATLLDDIHTEIRRLDSPSIRQGLGTYTAALLRVHLVNPSAAAHLHAFVSGVRGLIASSIWWIRSRVTRP